MYNAPKKSFVVDATVEWKLQKDTKEKNFRISNEVRVVKVVLGRIQLTGWIRDKEDIKIKTELMVG